MSLRESEIARRQTMKCRGRCVRRMSSGCCHGVLIRLVLLIAVFGPPGAAAAQTDEATDAQVELFDTLRDDYLKSLASIKTWHGEATIVSRNSVGDNVGRNAWTAHVRFVLDRENDAMQYYLKVTDVQGSGEQTLVKGADTGLLLIDAEKYRLMRGVDRDNQLRPVVQYPRAQPPHPRGYSFFNTEFDPLYTLRIEHRDPVEFFDGVRVYIATRPDWFRGGIQRLANGKTTVTIVNHARFPDFSTVHVFDAKYGSFVVSSIDYAPGNNPITKVEKEFEKVNGVWVPNQWTYSRHPVQGLPEKLRPKTIQITMSKQHVNEPLPADAFTLEFMGVKPGRKIENRATGETSIYKPDEVDVAP